MNDHPGQSSWEVVYLGVVRDCRGNALGRRMLAHGLAAARAAKRDAVLLAVDCRNDYAGKVYDDLKFVETGSPGGPSLLSAPSTDCGRPLIIDSPFTVHECAPEKI